ncbi:MAG: hypothetical protein JW871_08820 [Endomicrobiales bacterium]|nr:hypothetical protein [Endomicrobiales bacterium]
MGVFLMRMWMVEPQILCDKHLLGEHVECHMLAGHLQRKRRITNYIAFNLLEPRSLKQRHEILARQMRKRAMKHKSPLPRFSISYLPKEHQDYNVDAEKSLKDLVKRCPECRKRLKNLFYCK